MEIVLNRSIKPIGEDEREGTAEAFAEAASVSTVVVVARAGVKGLSIGSGSAWEGVSEEPDLFIRGSACDPRLGRVCGLRETVVKVAF